MMSDTRDPLKDDRMLGLQPSRRGFLGGGAGAAAGLALAGVLGMPRMAEAGAGFTDVEVLNFALNLEYLEAQYYSYATTGHGIPVGDLTGTGKHGKVDSVPPTPMVNFLDPLVQEAAMDIASDELSHVLFLRAALGDQAVAQPALNIGTAFATFAAQAGLGTGFDPFASDVNFLLGAFIFEDVGVTAYKGAIAVLTSSANVLYAAGIMGTEGYHGGLLRGFLAKKAQELAMPGIYKMADQISTLRDQLDGPGTDDEGLKVGGDLVIAPADANAQVYARSTTRVLDVVYGNTDAKPGLFYPSGMNGYFH
jgi:hypothetical protein